MNGLLLQDRGFMWVALVLGTIMFWFVGGTESRAEMMLVLPIFVTLNLVVHRRATPFEASLPILGRDLFLARLRIWLKAPWILAAIGCLIMLLRLHKFWLTGALTLCEMAAVINVAILVVHQYRPTEMSVPKWMFYAAGAALGICAFFGSAPLMLAGCAAATAILLPRTIHAAPKMYQIVTTGRVVWPGLHVEIRWGPLLRVMLPWQILFATLNFAIWSYELPFLAPLMLWVCLGHPMKKGSPWLFSLPIPRRRLFLGITALFALMTCAQFAYRDFLTSRFQTVHLGYTSFYQNRETPSTGTRTVQVALALWKRAPGGIAPIIAAPWGEHSRAATAKLLGFTIYNPFSVGRDNTEPFLDWQFQRATQATFGTGIPLSQYANMPQLRLKPLASQWKARLIDLTATWCWGFLYVSLFLAVRAKCRWGRWFDVVCLFAPLSFLLSIHWFSDVEQRESVSGMLLSRLAAALPGNPYTLAGICACALVVAYLLAEGQFRKLEAWFSKPEPGLE